MFIKINSWKIQSVVIVLVLSTSLVCSQMQLGWAISGIHQKALNLVREVKYEINSTTVNSSNLENPTDSRQQGNNISIKKDQEFNLYLKSNPTTGYEWIPIFNASIVKLISHSFKPSSLLMGASGTDTFVFKGMSLGTTLIKMQYKRSWENNSVAEKKFVVSIT
jgi:predicted secreted protein